MENKLDFFFLSLSCVLFFVGTVLTREGSSYYTSALRILFKRRDETGRRPIQIWIRPLRLQPFGKEGLLDEGRDKRSEVFNFTGIRDMYVSLESSIGGRKVGTHTHTHKRERGRDNLQRKEINCEKKNGYGGYCTEEEIY